MCASYILAQGVLTSDSPAKLQKLLNSITWQADVHFDSPGGDLAAALEVGRIIRKKMLTTHVAGNYEAMNDPADVFSESRTVVSEAQCYSACVYAFLGGSTRVLEEPGKLGIHQFSGISGDLGESAAQVGVAVLSRYVEQMGVDRTLLDLAASAPPDGIRLVPLNTAYALNIDNTHPPIARWNIGASDDGDLRVEATQRHAERDAKTTLLFSATNGITTSGVIVYSVQQFVRPPQEVLEILNDVVSEPRLRNGRSAAVLRPTADWRQIREGLYVRPFSALHQDLLSVAASPEIALEMDFPNCCRDVSPAVRFGTEGLLPGLRALARH